MSSSKFPPLDISNIDPKYKCPECKNIMINVHQADDCGCRYCLECLVKIIQKKKCIQCDNPVTSKIPDKYFQKKISNLVVNCCLKDCSWAGPLSEYTDHYNEHFEPKSKKCEHCSSEFRSIDEYQKHINKETGECSMQRVECIYKKIGCCSHLEDKTVVNDMNTSKTQTCTKCIFTRESLSSHYEVNASQHLKLVNDHFDSWIKSVLTILMTSLNQSNTCDNSVSSIEYIDSGYNPKYETVLEIKSDDGKDYELSYLFDTEVEYVQNCLTLDQNIDNNISYASNSSNNDQNTHLLNKIEELQNKLNDLENIMENIREKYRTSYRKTNILRKIIKDFKNIAQNLEKMLAMTQVRLLILDEHLINLEKVSYNGSLLWKITNVYERMQEAKSDCQTSFYSSPFYTNRNGYKMCARIYLNGDGNGTNTHMYLFFVILRGENDAILRWPFKQKVTFIIMDQSSSECKDNSNDAFRSELNSIFQRPSTDMEIDYESPAYFSLSKLFSIGYNQYIKDNTIFIKIIVDINGLEDLSKIN